MLLRRRTPVATIVKRGRGQVPALTLRTNGAHHINFLTIISRCFCDPRYPSLSLHTARFRRTATILPACGPLIASSHAEDDHGDRANWPGLLVRHTRIQFEPQHWRVAICAFYCGDDFLAVLVSCPHAREFNRYRTHGSGLGSVARRRLRSRRTLAAHAQLGDCDDDCQCKPGRADYPSRTISNGGAHAVAEEDSAQTHS
jgi:hypothetical protein